MRQLLRARRSLNPISLNTPGHISRIFSTLPSPKSHSPTSHTADNASKATPEGGKLKIEAVREGDWCQVSVIDNGIGIKEEDQERIFEPFCQLENPLESQKGGTGLGLPLVKQIVERYGGRIWVESQYGQGSRFTFILPLAAGNVKNGRGKGQ